MRRLIICFPGGMQSNAARLHDLIITPECGGITQEVHVPEDLGGDLQIGHEGLSTLDRAIISALDFLSRYDERQDSVYVIGAGDGAWCARRMVSLLGRVGLPPDTASARLAFSLVNGSVASKDEYAAFRHQHGTRDVLISALAVFDTIDPWRVFNADPRNQRVEHSSGQCCLEPGQHVASAFHALALDETRSVFAPLLWDLPSRGAQTREQRWFAGSHQDVAGGYVEHGLADIPLAWMCERLAEAHLGLRQPERDPFTGFETLHDSFVEYLDGRYARGCDRAPRFVLETRSGNEVIDASVTERMSHNSAYQPFQRAAVIDQARRSMTTSTSFQDFVLAYQRRRRGESSTAEFDAHQSRFEARFGTIRLFHYDTNTDGAAALCLRRFSSAHPELGRDSRTIHLVLPKPSGLIEAEMEARIYQCKRLHDQIDMLTDESERKTGARAAFSLIVELMSLIKATLEQSDFKNQLAGLDKQIEELASRCASSSTSARHIRYAVAMCVSFLAVLAIVSLFQWLNHELNATNFITLPRSKLFAGCVVAGAGGAIVSVLQRITNGSLVLDNSLSLRDCGILGLIRPLVGAAFGGVAMAVFLGQMLPGSQSGQAGEAHTQLTICAMAFFAGFTERFAQTIADARGLSPSGVSGSPPRAAKVEEARV